MTKKEKFLAWIEYQTNYRLLNENLMLNRHHNWLYAEIPTDALCRITSLFYKYNIKVEHHVGMYYFIQIPQNKDKI